VFPGEIDAYRHARQATRQLAGNVALITPAHRLLAWAGLLALPVLLLRPLRCPDLPPLPFGVLVPALGNMAVPGALSGPHHRHQSRLAWLFVLAAGMALAAVPSRSGSG
jgi:hypothetical protein